MIYTVFPDDQDRMPQDFQTYKEAQEYGEVEENGKYRIESTSGEVI